jgi:hypothetical protein
MSTESSAKAAPPRTAYLVLGMHRSGTSAVTQLLALAGADLPKNLMPGDEHNARGYFEPWKVAMFNDQRLRAAGGAWDDVFAFPHRDLPRRTEREWLNRAITLIGEEYGAAARPLLKDPRTTVLLPFWRTVLADLEIEARCVIPVRRPLAVAGSLARRNGFATEKSLLLWSAYMLAAEAYTRDLPRVFVDYDALLADWRGELGRIEAALGPGLPPLGARSARAVDKFLTTDLRHNAGEEDLGGYGWAGALTQPVYEWFAAAAADRPADAAPLEAAARELERRREEVGVLVSPVTRDLDALRAEVLQLRQQHDHESPELARLREERAAVGALVDSILAER